MNEQEFLCIIKHKVPEVQKRIFSILEKKLEITDLIERELSSIERIQLYGTEVPPKKRQPEAICMILIIKGNPQVVQEIIGTEGAPHLSPLNSIRYMYGETCTDNAIDLWGKEQKESVINTIFPKKQMRVAGNTKLKECPCYPSLFF